MARARRRLFRERIRDTLRIGGREYRIIIYDTGLIRITPIRPERGITMRMTISQLLDDPKYAQDWLEQILRSRRDAEKIVERLLELVREKPGRR